MRGLRRGLRWCWSLGRLFTRTVLALLLVASLALNVATVTVSGVYTVVSSAVGAVTGASTVLARQTARSMAQATAVRSTSRRVTKRVARGTARSTAAAAAEAIPLIGVAVIAASVAWEVADACAIAEDMHELEVALDDTRAGDVFSCTDLIPEAESLPSAQEIWQQMIGAPQAAWAAAQAEYEALPEISLSGWTRYAIDWLTELPEPDGFDAPPPQP